MDTTDFVSAYQGQSYRGDADKFYIRFDKKPYTWMNDANKKSSFLTKSKTDNIYFWNFAENSKKANAETLIANGSSKGNFTAYEPNPLSKNISDLRDYFINKYMVKQNSTDLTIVLGDKVDFTS